VCPHCGSTEGAYDLSKTRIGLKKCKVKECRKQFTVRVGTIFEDSHVPLHMWFQAAHLLCSSKKGISSHQLHRTLGVTYKTAWFMSHRLREAMRSGSLAPPKMGSGSQFVEIDETYIGNKKGARRRRGPAHKMAVLTLVERGRDARSFHIDNASVQEVFPIIYQNIDREAKIATDEGGHYQSLKYGYPGHDTVNHKAEEWRRGDVHTNTVEGYFSIFKRGMKGVYQHCSEKHLHRYLAEFDFRYNNRSALGVEDADRTRLAVRGAKGKRLTYQVTGRSRSEA
jgi:transposase-like protein